MSALLRLEEKHDLLKNELAENLQKKHDLELQISQEFEELKELEISLEKRTRNESGGTKRPGGILLQSHKPYDLK